VPRVHHDPLQVGRAAARAALRARWLTHSTCAAARSKKRMEKTNDFVMARVGAEPSAVERPPRTALDSQDDDGVWYPIKRPLAMDLVDEKGDKKKDQLQCMWCPESQLCGHPEVPARGMPKRSASASTHVLR
jgi:hypothetical protein